MGEWEVDTKVGCFVLNVWRTGYWFGLRMVMRIILSKYVGDIENMKPKGQGTITSPDGDKYEGEFKYGKKHGQGTFTSPDGYSYTGRWNEGNPNGLGTETIF